ncbi:MAG TPA: SPW repeat protein [Nocardiopsis listeri]|uniref:SPW repeat domain-containing protein n=1 Tax=Nocardiopsis listeri TaxID=53440 RepID=UPI001D72AE37|nr:SPW repeat protein [Nocardiopsis listeri]HJE58834.1 SPW repeat protein [Nocardiopsis listeri]
MRVKGRWADWGAIALGLVVGLSWIAHGMYGFSGGLFFILGLGVILAATMSLTRPGALTTEMGVIAGGVLLFALPWLLGFTHIPGAALTAWIGGGAILILGVYGLTKARAARRRDPELAWGAHDNRVPE